MGWLDKIASRIAIELDESGLDADEHAQLDLARAFLERGDTQEAEERVTPLLVKHPRASLVLQVAGELEQAKGNWEGAVTQFGRAVDVDASNARAWLSLAHALLPLSRFEPAMEACRRGTELLDKVLDAEVRRRYLAQAHALRGRVALAQSRFEVARREFDRALNLGLDDQSVAADHGRALVQLDPEEGARWLLHAARKSRASVGLVLEAAEAQEDANVAAELLAAFAKTNPELSDADRCRVQARTTLAWAQAGAMEKAKALLAAVATDSQIARQSASVCGDLAHAAAVLGDYHVACEWAACAENSERPLSPQEQLVWALGTRDRSTLSGLAARLEASQPELAGQVNTALASPPDANAVAALVHAAPTAEARAHWAQLLSPALPEEDSALSLLQALEQIITALPPSPELAAALARAREALSRPLVVALLGEFNAGKSSLVNALVQVPLAPVGIKPTTATLNVFRHGLGGAHVVHRNGKLRQLHTAQVQPFLATLAQEDAEAIEAVDIFLPHAPLQTFEWVDTPGLNAPNVAHEQTTRQFMSLADVAVWVLSAHQAAKATEVAVLKELHASHTPVLAVLNKIDQLEPEEIPAVHQAVAEALSDAVFGIIDASLKTEAHAQHAAQELSQALLAFCDGRVGSLKQRSALLKLRGLVAEAGAQASRLQPSNVATAPDASLWRHVSDNLAQPLAVANLNTALSQLVAEVAAVFCDAGADSAGEESLIRAFLRHLLAALSLARAQIQGLPQTAVEQFEVAAQAFAAQARGRLEGGLAASALLGKAVLPARRKLEQALPDAEGFLWAPWRQQLKALLAREQDREAQIAREVAARAALHNAQFTLPLQALNGRVERAWHSLLAKLRANPS